MVFMMVVVFSSWLFVVAGLQEVDNRPGLGWSASLFIYYKMGFYISVNFATNNSFYLTSSSNHHHKRHLTGDDEDDDGATTTSSIL